MDGRIIADKMMPPPAAAADGDSWCESRLRRSSQRWLWPGLPEFPLEDWIPAFPHRGTHEDVENLKRLLSVIRANHLFPSSKAATASHNDDKAAVLAADKRTCEGGGGGGGDDGHPQQQATLLQHMVEMLKQLGSSLLVMHNSSCVPSITLDELRLYGLILRHVESYMLLHLMEESAKRDEVPAELLANMVKQVGSFLADNHIGVDESVVNSIGGVGSDLFSVWNGFTVLISFLEDYAASISNMSPP